MLEKMNASSVLDRYFLEMRQDVLKLASAFDRLRAGGDAESLKGDPRVVMLIEGIGLLGKDEADLTKRVQLVFSKPYDQNWRGSK